MTALREDMSDLKGCFTMLEVQVSHLAVIGASYYVQTALRLDIMEHYLERRADIIPA